MGMKSMQRIFDFQEKRLVGLDEKWAGWSPHGVIHMSGKK